jgi:hypothetical protein
MGWCRVIDFEFWIFDFGFSILDFRWVAALPLGVSVALRARWFGFTVRLNY